MNRISASSKSSQAEQSVSASRSQQDIDGRSKARPGVEEQSRVLQTVATELFLERGTDVVTISDICKAADVSRPTFYRCFADKEQLLEVLYRVSVFEPVESIMLSLINSADVDKGAVRQALETLLEAIFARHQAAELLFRESQNPHSPAFAIVDAAFDNIVTKMLKVLPPSANPITLKALLVAQQWIAHDAIRKNLTGSAVAEAKNAAWSLAKNFL